jgi:signal transduction histidine kinase
MYVYQYLVGGSLSLLVSLYILSRRPRTLALKLLFVYGLIVALWEISAILSISAADKISASNYLYLNLLTSGLSFPLYLLTVLNIRGRPSRSSTMVLIAVAIQMALFQEFFADFDVVLTESGWAYRIVGNSPLFYVYGAIFVGYMASIVVVLADLTRKTMFSLLRKKYAILLLSFAGFQAIGTSLTNALVAFNVVDASFRIGGVLQFMTFLSIWYALALRGQAVSFSLSGGGFSSMYSSFLTVFYGSVIGSGLGEDAFKFKDFIRRSKIENQVLIARDKITFKKSEHLDLAELISRNLAILDKGFSVGEFIDSYLRVLNAADQSLGWKFEAVVKANEDFLKKSDLIYGISEGSFLERVVEDNSLRDLEDVDACLRIYKRILLQIVNKVRAEAKFVEKLSEDYITKAMKITDYGEILMDGVRDRLLSVPKDRRLSLTIEKFNSVVSWAYEIILMDPSADVEEILRKLRLVLTLNKERAVAMGIYPTLLGTLATKIPQTQVHRLYSDYLEELVEERTEELEKTQKELLKSQRLAAIGEVAAMVGHDLRNPLQSIVNMMYLTREKLNSAPLQGSELLKLAETVEEQVRYMNKVVSDLEDFARPLKMEFAPADLHELINETLSNIRVPDSVKVSIIIEDDLDFPKLTVDTALMKRVFINLITNALQAMPDGGDLKIAAKRMEDSALVSIQDTGVGIPEENMDKIFQPLFSTKAKGQGLGLSVCKRLVEAHDGSITFKSKVGKGSTFTVEIPLRYMADNKKEPEIIAHAA